MARRILLVQGHPDPVGGHLCHGLMDAYAEGARAAGHEVRVIDIARLDFPLLRSAAAFEKETPPPTIVEAQEAIVWAEHLVLVFPLWLGTMPALVKAFLEQTLRPSFAFAFGDKGMPRKLLTGRSARLVVTMGMPALIYRWYFMAHGLRGLERNVLGFVGIKPVRESLFGMVDKADETRRRRWIERMRGLGQHGA